MVQERVAAGAVEAGIAKRKRRATGAHQKEAIPLVPSVHLLPCPPEHRQRQVNTDNPQAGNTIRHGERYGGRSASQIDQTPATSEERRRSPRCAFIQARKVALGRRVDIGSHLLFTVHRLGFWYTVPPPPRIKALLKPHDDTAGVRLAHAIIRLT